MPPTRHGIALAGLLTSGNRVLGGRTASTHHAINQVDFAIRRSMFVLEMKVAHPTKSILESLEHEIRFWCENHGVEIREINQNQID
jgi:hypothetical protein